MNWETFKDWYMARYWDFDNLFLNGAKLFGITYHEFVLITLVVIWPAVTLAMTYTILRMWRTNQRLRRITASVALVSLFLFSTTVNAIAGPSPEDMDFSIKRPATVSTVVRGDYRFDVILPSNPNYDLHGGENSSWYGDELLIVRKIETGDIVYSRSLKSEHIEFLLGGLSDEYAVISEWSGGASCCLLVTVFRVRPEFEIILQHDNNKFDSTNIISGPHELELYFRPKYSIGWNTRNEYSFEIIDLRENNQQ